MGSLPIGTFSSISLPFIFLIHTSCNNFYFILMKWHTCTIELHIPESQIYPRFRTPRITVQALAGRGSGIACRAIRDFKRKLTVGFSSLDLNPCMFKIRYLNWTMDFGITTRHYANPKQIEFQGLESRCDTTTDLRTRNFYFIYSRQQMKLNLGIHHNLVT